MDAQPEQPSEEVEVQAPWQKGHQGLVDRSGNVHHQKQLGRARGAWGSTNGGANGNGKAVRCRPVLWLGPAECRCDHAGGRSGPTGRAGRAATRARGRGEGTGGRRASEQVVRGGAGNGTPQPPRRMIKSRLNYDPTGPPLLYASRRLAAPRCISLRLAGR